MFMDCEDYEFAQATVGMACQSGDDSNSRVWNHLVVSSLTYLEMTVHWVTSRGTVRYNTVPGLSMGPLWAVS